MGASIEFFAAPSDDQALREFGESIGLRVVSILFDKRFDVLTDPRADPACFLTFNRPDELHPYGPKRLIGDATDPVIEFTRSVYEPPDLVAGRIYWSDDVEEFGRQTRAHFRKLVSWIRRNWQRREDGYYAGPQAVDLLSSGVATPRYMRPGVKVRRVEI